MKRIVEYLYIFYNQLSRGYWNCRSSFFIWNHIMTNNLETLNRKLYGPTAFDEFYDSLNGIKF